MIIADAIALGGMGKFAEFDCISWNGLPQLAKAGDFYWTLPSGTPFLPLAFALAAERID